MYDTVANHLFSKTTIALDGRDTYDFHLLMRIRSITPPPNTASSTRHIDDPWRLTHTPALLQQRRESLHHDSRARDIGLESGRHACGKRGRGGFFTRYGSVVDQGVEAAVFLFHYFLSIGDARFAVDVDLQHLHLPRQPSFLQKLHSGFTLFERSAAEEDQVFTVMQELGGEFEADSSICYYRSVSN